MRATNQLKHLRKSLGGKVRSLARQNTQIVEPAMHLVSRASTRAETAIRKKLALPPPSVEIRHSPSRAELHPPIRMKTHEGRDQISRAIHFKGWQGFEYPLPLLLEAVLRSERSGLFFDVGANTGLYTLLSKSINPQRGVHAFEPFPVVRDILNENIASNPFANDIVVADVAASDSAGIAELFIPTQEHGLIETSASLSSTFKTRHSDVIEVNTLTLDDYFKRAGCISPVAVMKIDTEGAEDRVLCGSLGIMMRDHPIIFCEILPDSDTLNSIFAIVAKTGYTLAAIHPTKIIVQSSKNRDLVAHNHILFSTDHESAIRSIVSSIGLDYQG